MKIENNFNQLDINMLDFESNAKKGNSTEKAAFGEIFDAAIDLFNKTNEFQVQADKEQIDFATGKKNDMLSLMLAQEKAATTLNFTVQATNKVIESYKEIMRMQV